MGKVLITLKSPDGAPITLKSLMERFGLRADDIDKEFGLIEIDPKNHIYTALVEADTKLARGLAPGYEVEGPFSNPRIEPFDLSED